MRGLAYVVLAIAFISSAEAGLFGPGWAEKRDQANACYAAADGQPEFQRLRAKFTFGPPSLDQLSDDGTPAGDDIALIRAYWDRRQSCRAMMVAAMREHHPFLVAAYELRNFQWDVVVAHLLRQRIAFGNANRLVYQAELEYQQRKSQYDQARSEQQRRALADSMNTLAQQARSAPPPPGAGRLTCRWVGPSLYCDPY